MKTLKQYANEKKLNGRKVIKKWRVASKSEKGEYHIVSLLDDRSYTCTCIAGLMNRVCRHKRLVAKKLKDIPY